MHAPPSQYLARTRTYVREEVAVRFGTEPRRFENTVNLRYLLIPGLAVAWVS